MQLSASDSIHRFQGYQVTRVAVITTVLAALIISPRIVAAQGTTRLNLFLDCAMHCDRQFLRADLTSVNWVTDPTAADVHVIATRLQTGAGGHQVTLILIGRDSLEGLTDTLKYSTQPDASSDDSRRELLRMLRLGLVRYQLAAGKARQLSVVAAADEGVPTPTPPVTDPWKHWVFNVGMNGELNAESREVGYELGGDIRANHVTEALKVRLHLGGDLDRTTFTLDSGQKFVARRDRWNGSALVVRSAGPHWSFGATGSVRGSKPDNLDLRTRLAPALEWDLYPYSEASNRQLYLIYSLGVTHYDYVDETIYDKLAETRIDHEFKISFESRQQWGSARLSGSASTFIDDWSRNRLSLRGGLGLRVAKGLQLEANGSVSRVRDQISLRKGDASDEEVFLRLRELATDYKAEVKLGLSYTFGSFFNTIVNPRFDEVY